MYRFLKKVIPENKLVDSGGGSNAYTNILQPISSKNINFIRGSWFMHVLFLIHNQRDKSETNIPVLQAGHRKISDLTLLFGFGDHRVVGRLFDNTFPIWMRTFMTRQFHQTKAVV